MIGATLALILAAGAPTPDDLSRRMGQSAAAAQALQGPLDGAWILSDGRGRRLYDLQITDPAGGAVRIGGAWRDGATGRTGVIDAISRRGHRLTLRLDGTAIGLGRSGGEMWTGHMRADRHPLDVRLRRAVRDGAPGRQSP